MQILLSGEPVVALCVVLASFCVRECVWPIVSRRLNWMQFTVAFPGQCVLRSIVCTAGHSAEMLEALCGTRRMDKWHCHTHSGGKCRHVYSVCKWSDHVTHVSKCCFPLPKCYILGGVQLRISFLN